ncbi:hypothetical protein MPTK1_1g00990 [Marchantia polymorpha subsp. ruderalis]|uniref:TmcB/TmcC TPR repeats domain-containing protein n=2 Tax=Marchantia polymorpha TaxID=3197 RepID=A0AAF6AK53_MARPO|nr:hypothetical protein MARPO_0029s0147 [Marchantia polymorpha]BBM96823.1 hypothetical protein Mp_1g00990 [Marchantia polymorpha subsp. ruderalis]|eukprot:PTQ42660.1 hypothetical protein MARPO_0029s0147 [Marchantia polymorpha]
MVLTLKMLLRSSSTPLLTSLTGVPLASLPYTWTGRDVEREKESPRRPGLHRSVSFSSVALVSGASSPISQHVGLVDDNRSVDGSEWDFSGDVVPWPRFKRVQSEGELEVLSPGSSLIAAAESLLPPPSRNGNSETNFDGDKKFSTIGRQWSRRVLLRRQSSLSVIPSNSEGSSSCASESEDVQIESLEGVEIDTPGFNDVVEDEIPDYGTSSGNEGFRGSDYLTQMGEYSLLNPNSTKANCLNACDADAGSSDGLESEFRLASEATQGFSAKLAWGSGRDGSGYHGASDGEGYTSIATAANGNLLICNSRGCKPVTNSDHVGPMFIAGGFGMGGGGGSGRNGSVGTSGGSGRGDSLGTDAYYKRALEADPGHPLLLRNYAKFLHEVKRDTSKAESYYERAILANPGDGEVLGLYAKLIWDVYKDEERSGSYFEQALQAAPDNSYVVAAYASFMWASDDVEESPEQLLHCSGQGAGLPSRYSSVTS